MTEHPVRRLSEREGRRAKRGSPTEAVPSHLVRPLREWTNGQLYPELERKIALLLEVDLGQSGTIGRRSLSQHADVELLEVVGLVLQLDTDLQQDAELDADAEGVQAAEDADAVFAEVPNTAEELDELLTDGNSTYRVARHARPLQLVNVVDPTVATAAASAVESAEEKASDRLSDAWVAAHAVHPDPDGAYANAVRAVEVVIASVVSPRNAIPTLGTAIRDLRNGAHNYELVLLNNDGDGSVEPLLALLERLWQGQKSRHGAGAGARPQTPEEARAAVQIAVLVVQWLTDGVLRRRPTDTGSTS